jgi:pilus assembly protein Flp/PilA
MFELLSVYLSQLIARFSRDEEGAGLVEYGMLVALIAVVVGVAVTLFGNNLSTGWNTLAGNVTTWFAG